MDSRTSISRGRLEHAEGLLREVIDRDFDAKLTGEGGSLNRILVHIVNMNRVVRTSSGENMKVAKPLGNFAHVRETMSPPTPESAARPTRLASALNSASEALKPEPAEKAEA